MPPTTTTPSSPSSISTASIAKLSTSALMEEAAETARALDALAGRIVLVAAELDRREAWRRGRHLPRGLARRALPRLDGHGTGVGPRRDPALRPAQARRGALWRLDQLRPGTRRGRRRDPRERSGPRGRGRRVLGAPTGRAGQDAEPGAARPAGSPARTRAVRFDERHAHDERPAPRGVLRRGARRARGAGEAPCPPTARRAGTSAWPTPSSPSCARAGRSGRPSRVIRQPHRSPGRPRAPMSSWRTCPWPRSSTTTSLWPASSKSVASSTPRSCGAWPVTPRWSLPSTTTSVTRCTRAGLEGSLRPPSAGRSGAGTDIAASRAVPTRSSSTPTTCGGGDVTTARRTSTIWPCSVSTTITWCIRTAGRSRATPTPSSPSSARVAGS